MILKAKLEINIGEGLIQRIAVGMYVYSVTIVCQLGIPFKLPVKFACVPMTRIHVLYNIN